MTHYEYLIKSIDEHGDRDECLLWPYALRADGYGKIRRNKHYCRVHKLALEKVLGRTILPGLYACHRCRNRHCFAPAHLYEGTPTENSFDKIADGTFQEGGKCTWSKLTEEDVLAIREKCATGRYTQKHLANEYNVNQAQIFRVIHGENWKHLPIATNPRSKIHSRTPRLLPLPPGSSQSKPSKA